MGAASDGLPTHDIHVRREAAQGSAEGSLRCDPPAVARCMTAYVATSCATRLRSRVHHRATTRIRCRQLLHALTEWANARAP